MVFFHVQYKQRTEAETYSLCSSIGLHKKPLSRNELGVVSSHTLRGLVVGCGRCSQSPKPHARPFCESFCGGRGKGGVECRGEYGGGVGLLGLLGSINRKT